MVYTPKAVIVEQYQMPPDDQGEKNTTYIMDVERYDYKADAGDLQKVAKIRNNCGT